MAQSKTNYYDTQKVPDNKKSKQSSELSGASGVNLTQQKQVTEEEDSARESEQLEQSTQDAARNVQIVGSPPGDGGDLFTLMCIGLVFCLGLIAVYKVYTSGIDGVAVGGGSGSASRSSGRSSDVENVRRIRNQRYQ